MADDTTRFYVVGEQGTFNMLKRNRAVADLYDIDFGEELSTLANVKENVRKAFKGTKDDTIRQNASHAGKSLQSDLSNTYVFNDENVNVVITGM